MIGADASVKQRANGRTPDGATSAGAERRRSVAADQASVPQVALDHEELVVRRGRRSGLHVAVAVHSTVLGPALGGLRIWSYASVADGVRDVLRLSAGMTLKAAAAGLELGGGKGVICAPADGLDAARRREALLDFGDLVQSLEGRYVTAEDVGCSPPDLVAIAERTSHLTGLPPEHGGSGDPSPFTALGVERAMRACCEWRLGSPDLSGRRIVVVGLGHVGGSLARGLAAAGAELVVSDISERAREQAAELGAEWLEPELALEAECDVLAPCALGGAVNPGNVERLRCRVVCGSANNQLADDSLAARLAEREILYAPDFLVNSGGLINVAREVHGYSEDRVLELIAGIGEAMRRVLAEAERSGATTLDAARAIANARLEAGAGGPVVPDLTA